MRTRWPNLSVRADTVDKFPDHVGFLVVLVSMVLRLNRVTKKPLQAPELSF